MKRILPLLTLSWLFLCSSALAQESPIIFGYFQTTYSTEDGYLYSPLPPDPANPMLPPAAVVKDVSAGSFFLQQANGFLNKPLSDKANAFLNVELTNSFSSSENWGSFSLEEAWVKYQFSDAVRVRGGLLIPTFNNLNTIKNRTPLLPYLFRPAIYETLMSAFVDGGDFIPERAFAQVDGKLPAGPALMEYAVYVGNSDRSFTATNYDFGVSGIDSTGYLMIGGRLGVSHPVVRAGVSATYDRDNLTVLQGTRLASLGVARRTRLGADLSVSLVGFTLNGEYIQVLNDEDLPYLDADKRFYYGTLLYDLTERFFGYATYSYMDDQMAPQTREGIVLYGAGAGFRAFPGIVLKAQYQSARSNENPVGFELKEKRFLVGASVLF